MGLVTQRLHITPNAFGVLDGRSDTGTPIPPTLTWAPVPSYLQKLQGTPFSVDISVYLTSTSADPITFTLLSGTWPSGWSISSTGTISYDGSAIGAATVSIRATQDASSADSNTFTVESIAVAQTDTLAPTIPTGVALVSKTSSTIAVACDAPADISASDAVPYTGMKEVRWFKGGVFDGVSSMSAGLSLRLSQTTVSDGTGGGRKFNGGHGVAFQNNQVWSGTPYGGGTYVGIPNPNTISDTGPVTSDTLNIQLRHQWNHLEPTSGTYDFSSVTADLAQVAAFSAHSGRNSSSPIMLYLMVEVKTFNGLIPLPADLVAVADGGTGSTTYATAFTAGGNPGYMTWRWHATVKARYQALIAALGAQFDSHPNFGGIATQETSISGGSGGGYSATSYCQALKDESDYITTAFPTSRHLFYFNFITGASNAQILDVLAHLQPNGAILTGPDLVESGSLTTNVYPYLQKYKAGTNGIPAPGPIGSSVQISEWSANGFPAGVAWMRSLFNYLHASHSYTTASDGSALTDYTSSSAYGTGGADFMMWNYVTSAQAGNHNQKYNSNSTEIQHDHPTFGTFAPTSTFVAGTLAQSGANYTIVGNGAGIGSTSDEWTSGRTNVTGDVTIIAKVASVTGTLTNAFAGICFREDDTASSRAVHLIQTSAGVTSKYRSIAGSTATTVSTAATPVLTTATWLKISRVGNLFSFYYSTTGLAWTALGSISIAIASAAHVEIFSGGSSATTTSFEQVCIQNLTNPAYTFTGLSASTAYSLTAVARDGVNNDSAASAALSVTTSSAAVSAYTLRSVGTAASGTGAVSPGMPAGWQVGDLLLLWTESRDNGQTLATPSGWTLLSPSVNVGWNSLYGRIAVGGDTAPSIDYSATPHTRAQIAAFTGNVYTDLATIVHASIDRTGANVSIPYVALTISLANCLVIALGTHNKTATTDGTTVDDLSGFARLDRSADTGTGMASWWGYQQQTTAISLGAVTQTLTGTTESLNAPSALIALRTS